MIHPAISVENLSKAYRIGVKDDLPDTMIGAIQGLLKAPWKNWRRLARLDTFRHQEEADDLFWALRNVSFEVPEGEVVGVIGRNGAGKSTLLKILSRITEPTAGRAVIQGRVSSLLEVGTGFHQELSGRDNIYMNGTILGMTKREIDRKFDEIIDFSGVEKFLDTPIKHYSSGMKVRLAFSVAAHLEPEILIIDEVLAVGDAEFQRKCIGKMGQVARSGRTVLFVSHNMAALEAICTTGIELSSGEVVFKGSAAQTIAHYRERIYSGAEMICPPGKALGEYILAACLLDAQGRPAKYVAIGSDVTIELTVQASAKISDARIRIAVDDLFGTRLLMVQTPISDKPSALSGEHKVRCTIHEFPLAPGVYSVMASLAEGREMKDEIRQAMLLPVEDAELFGEGRGFSKGVCAARSSWAVGNATNQSPAHALT